eukprot:m.479618 g.479618  ORF g.479618 m.479618 type:complete len:578 (+) comp21529_c0_seq1:370-2103(+)
MSAAAAMAARALTAPLARMSLRRLALASPTGALSAAAAAATTMHLTPATPPRRLLHHSTSQRGLPLTQDYDDTPFASLSDADLLELIQQRKLSLHKLEKELGDTTRAVRVRRQAIQARLQRGEPFPADDTMPEPLAALPVDAFDAASFYDSIDGANCEAVIGYLPVPVGVAGPLCLDGREFHVPLATTEGALVASTNRGCRAIALAGGATSVVMNNGMTRAPLLRCPSVAEAAAIRAWVEEPENVANITEAFNSTTRFGRLVGISTTVAGRNAYVRFVCNPGDAMGMNMVTKGSHKALEVILAAFPNSHLLSMSGNVCSDKKPAAVNWVNGRGRSVACEVVIPRDVVEKTLKTSVDAIIELNTSKNLVGSAVAGSLGGFNAHASNLVSAVFLATGNDIAQNVESSSCLTLMEREGEDLHLSVTMPSIEVGTVGGGTTLPGQKACLELLGCAGANRSATGANADTLARVVAGTVMAGELSLMAALASNDLLKAHMDLNRKQDAAPAAPSASSTIPPAAAAANPTQRRGAHTLTMGRGQSAVNRIQAARYRAGFDASHGPATSSSAIADADFEPRLPVP